MEKRFGVLSSSADPEKLAGTVQGIILSLSSLLIFFSGQMGLPITEGDVVQGATQIGAVVGGVWFLYGLIRKVVVYFAKG